MRLQGDKTGDVTIISFRMWRNPQDLRRQFAARVYYFEGNVFGPLELAAADEKRLVKTEVARWLRDNAAMVAADRAKPGYKSLTQLFDEQVVAA